MKRGKQRRTEGIQLPNQDEIRTLGEDTYKYLGILETDIIEHAEMKGKIKKNTPGERESYWKSKYIAEIL